MGVIIKFLAAACLALLVLCDTAFCQQGTAISDQTEEPSPSGEDYAPMYSVSASRGRRVHLKNIVQKGHGLLDGFLQIQGGEMVSQSASDQRAAIGLGSAAVADIGTTSGTVAAGDHTHAGYQEADADLSSLASGIIGPVKGAGNGSGYSAAAYTDFVGLWALGSCTGYLKSDGNCDSGGAVGDIDDLPGDTVNDGYIDPGLVNPAVVRDEIGRVWSAAPTGDDLVVGMFYWANNEAAGWDPSNIAGTDDYQVMWSGSVWIPIQDVNGTFFMESISESVPIADADGTGTLTWSFAFSDARTATIPGDSSFTVATIPAAGSWKSIYVHPGAFRVDGTNCAAVTSAAINSGPYIYYTACSDAAGTIDVQVVMPENWDGGNLFIEPEVFSAEASPSGTIEFEISIQARGNDETINNTWVTTNGNAYFEDAETTATTVDTQYDFFKVKNKTAMAASGAGGDLLFVRLTRDNDDGTHDTSTQAIRVVGLKIFYLIDSFEERD